MTFKVTIPQARFLNLEHRFKAFVAGYGSGKTFVGSVDICKNFLQNPGMNQGYFAPTYPQIRDIFYPTIEEVAYLMNTTVEIKEGNKEVHFYTGRQYRGTCICRSMERPQSIIGFKISHALIDEIDVLTEERATTAWRKIIARMRYLNANNTIDVTTTPEGFLFTYKTFVKALNDDPAKMGRYAIIQASTYDNEKNLPADYIPSLVEAYPKELIAAYLNGQFVNMKSGTVYYAFDRRENNSKETVKKNEPLKIGMDFNVQHMAATVYVIRKDGWHAVHEFKEIFDTPAMIKEIQHTFKNHQITIYPDASGDSRKSLDASKSDIKLLRNAGFSIKTHKTNPYIKDRVMSVNKQFQDKELWVNVDKCPTVANCLEQQNYGLDGLPNKTSGHDHQNDATGYPIAYEFPIIKPQFGLTSIRMAV
jgi:hypothetical protein